MIMNVCFVFDKGYIGQFKVTAYSLIVNNRNEQINLHLLVHAFTDREKSEIGAFLGAMKVNYAFYDIDERLFYGLADMNGSHATYYKLLIPEFLGHLDSVLYLDCDIIVRKPLTALFAAKQNAPLAAVADSYVNRKQAEHAKAIVKDRDYFNAGVMFYHFDAPHPAFEKVISYARENTSEILYHDQDILNHFYGANYVCLDERYNYFTIYRNLHDVFYSRRRPVIVHYAAEKPWRENYINKFYGLYKKYYKACSKVTALDFLQKRRHRLKAFFIKLSHYRSKRKEGKPIG